MNNYGLILLWGLLTPLSSFALVTLEKIHPKSANEFELTFKDKISREQIATEAFNDIVQLTFRDASVYPAKIIPISEGSIKKIFAYQYSPKVVRCRFSMAGKAETFKSQFSISGSGRSILLSFEEVPAAPVLVNGKNGKDSEEIELDEKALIQKVLESDQPKAENRVNSELKSDTESSEVLLGQKPSRNLTGGKPLPSLKSSFLKLFGVLGLLLALTLVLKKIKKVSLSKSSGNEGQLTRALKKFAQGSVGGDERLIQVISTHHLDPKKSIAVVKVAGRMLVLGVSNEAIHLITQIAEHPPELDALEEDWDESAAVGSPKFFEKILTSEKSKPNAVAGVRSRIKSRLEGLKPL